MGEDKNPAAPAAASMNINSASSIGPSVTGMNLAECMLQQCHHHWGPWSTATVQHTTTSTTKSQLLSSRTHTPTNAHINLEYIRTRVAQCLNTLALSAYSHGGGSTGTTTTGASKGLTAQPQFVEEQEVPDEEEGKGSHVALLKVLRRLHCDTLLACCQGEAWYPSLHTASPEKEVANTSSSCSTHKRSSSNDQLNNEEVGRISQPLANDHNHTAVSNDSIGTIIRKETIILEKKQQQVLYDQREELGVVLSNDSLGTIIRKETYQLENKQERVCMQLDDAE